MKKYASLLCILFCLGTGVFGQLKFIVDVDYNLTESKVPAYTLPDVLQMANGKKLNSIKEWQTVQKPYLYHLFEENVYGKFPAQKIQPVFKLLDIDSNALNGTAIRKQVRVYFTRSDTTVHMDILLYLPRHSKKTVPVFVGLNFGGNQTINNDAGIYITDGWVNKGKGVVNNKATDTTRGAAASQWNVPQMLAKGYGLATVYYGDLEPDYIDGWKTGIRTSLKNILQIQTGQWSAMGAWAWGLCRVMDYLQTDKNVNAKQVAIIGHSRLGKAALWAAASDRRFAIIISNESGEGGAALSKRYYGETVRIINQKFPHWFAVQYKNYNDKTDLLPVDQHMLLSLLAPRPLYVASADGDQWSDPKGEFLGAKNAATVYRLFNKNTAGLDSMPLLHQPVGNIIRYHIRSGKHDVTDYDWQQYLDFADRYFKK